MISRDLKDLLDTLVGKRKLSGSLLQRPAMRYLCDLDDAAFGALWPGHDRL
jgi:hypothetical protein